ncbi:hypothetical protein KIL84_003467 [Mauremys mutica]|uniref:Uncharacterized protein n=1 Tax=Mauremys mutica TaxID=74926 RepID=A0A9D4ARH6_9SAUR|nr:hypothetical protein KIL84_003467 [Mauremys mutica]
MPNQKTGAALGSVRTSAMWARPPLPLPLLPQRRSQSQEPMAGEGAELLFPGQQVTAPPPRNHLAFPNPAPTDRIIQSPAWGALHGTLLGSYNSSPRHRELDRDQGQAQGLGEDVMSSPMEKDSLDRTQES